MIRSIASRLAKRVGYRVTRLMDESAGYEQEFLAIWDRCRPYTMTSIERAYGLWTALNYISPERTGDVVECGVWRGGSSMIAALTLMARDDIRDLYLYDTFTGMSEPTAEDVGTFTKKDTADFWRKAQQNDHNDWCFAPLEEVEANLKSTGYPADRLHFIRGPVEDTLPTSQHQAIALLRLDTDWYASTKVEMESLYPRLVPGGVLIIDDFGYWEGARKAVEDYLAENEEKLLLSRLDYTGRMALKAFSR